MSTTPSYEKDEFLEEVRESYIDALLVDDDVEPPQARALSGDRVVALYEEDDAVKVAKNSLEDVENLDLIYAGTGDPPEELGEWASEGPHQY
ncbi:MAG: hypothetical protein ABEJ03_04915 [Candidatus Nanohaloarchaea archaeon]